MRKFFLLFCACNILFLSARESTLAAVTKSVPKIYSSRQPLVYSAKSIETQHYIRTMNYLITKDYIGLRFAQEEGLNINAKSKNGDTAVCTSIKRKQYHWFNMLKSAGADMYADCVKSIDIEKRDQFIDNYIKMGGSIDLDTKDALLVTSPVNWWSVGGIVGGVALAGGVTALALSGGGSSSSSNSSEGGASHGENADIPNGKPVKYPTNPTTSDVTNPEYYKTAEFGGSNFKPVQNFLGQVNAQYAYAYAAAAGKNIAGEGIVIGEVDTGVDYSHQELSSRIATDANDKKLAINFHYGPCKEGDKRNCWVVENNFAYFYGASETVEKSSYLGTLNYSYWIKYKNSFPDDYDWDENKNASIIYSASSGSGAEYIKQAVHGTHVAGIMVAEKNGKWMHGLAYNSKIISAGIDLGWLPSSNGYGILPSYQYLISNGAKVINNSWGSSETLVKDVLANVNNFNQQYEDDLKLALSYTASKSVVSLFAAGNDAANNEGNQKNAGLTAAAPMAIPELLYYRDSNGELQAFSSYPLSNTDKIVSSLFITVVSVNANNEIASYSQKCGPAAKWCIAAPGGDVDYLIASTAAKSVIDWYGMGGTSQATPVVTSALAVLMAAYPSLSAQEAVALLFETATKIGSEDLYGHGLLNLKAAMEPVGTLSLPTGNSLSGVTWDGTYMILPHSFDALSDIPTDLIVLDKYKRSFNIKTNAVIRSTSHSKQLFARDLRLFTKATNRQNVKLFDNLSFAFLDTSSAFDRDALSGKSFALTWHNEDDIELRFAFSSDGSIAYIPYFENELTNPFVSAINESYTLSGKLKVSDSLNFLISGTIGENNFFDGNELKENKNDDTASSMQAELSYQLLSNVSVNLSGGLLNEKSSTLGMSGYSAFETKGGNTYFFGAQVNALPFEKTHIGFGYYRGYTKGRKQNVFVTISDLISDSFGFHSAYDLTKQLQIGFNIASPLRVRKGNILLDLPISRSDTSDVVYRQQSSARLSPGSREWDYSIYAAKKTQLLSWQTMGTIRIHPEHIENAKPDYRVMVGFTINY